MVSTAAKDCLQSYTLVLRLALLSRVLHSSLQSCTLYKEKKRQSRIGNAKTRARENIEIAMHLSISI
jgi:hypothetical protein